ncbi:secretin and TonB N-terminal domain-containing protein [candidate division WOR-3 bacterium]|nr:secretin and TonB N-terminal domain-containing protein [candidate division WOR-3 bacterium]
MKKWIISGLMFLLLASGLYAEKDKPVTIRFQDADIRMVIQTFAELGNINIVVSENVTGTISLNLRRVAWEDAFKTLLDVHGLAAVEQERMIGVMTMEEFDERRKMVDLETEVFRITHANACGIMGVVREMMSDRGRINVDIRTNSLVVTDIPSIILDLKALIDTIDIPTAQVMIKARIVEVSHRTLKESGLRWLVEGDLDGDTQFEGTLEASAVAPFSLTFGTLHANIDIDALLTLLEAQDKARILSEPSVAVADHEEAMVLSGKKIPIVTTDIAGNRIIKFYDVAIRLAVRPRILPNGEIMMELHPEVSNLSAEATVEGGIIILTSEVRTRLRVRDGETAVIGGVIKTKESTVQRGIPFISNIPLLGRLFKYHSTTKEDVEIMIFITPRIIPIREE